MLGSDSQPAPPNSWCPCPDCLEPRCLGFLPSKQVAESRAGAQCLPKACKPSSATFAPSRQPRMLGRAGAQAFLLLLIPALYSPLSRTEPLPKCHVAFRIPKSQAPRTGIHPEAVLPGPAGKLRKRETSGKRILFDHPQHARCSR